MKFWDAIINNATLGSAKMPLQSHDLPEFVTEGIEMEHADPEDEFLRLASLAYQYRQAGSQPIVLNQISQVRATDELLPYASPNSTSIFKTIMSEEASPLLILWLRQCETKGVLAEPELIPELLDIASRKKELRKIILTVCGKRGEWLCQLNPEWNFHTVTDDVDSLWQNGKPDERKELLRGLRVSNHEKSIELLRSTWDAEGANEKVAFLEILKINLSDADLGWLESLKEKGQKVNTILHELLKSIPSSAIVQQYWNAVKDHVTIKTGKALLGMISKTVIEVNENVSVEDSLFKTGIEKLSSNKQVSDAQYILIQLITSVPPSHWSEHLKANSQTIIELFQKDKKTALYLPALALASIRFGDVSWTKAILDHGDEALIDSSVPSLVRALPEHDRETYLVRFMKSKPQEIVAIALDQNKEWGRELARAILKYTASEIYMYNRTFYKPAASLIPINVLDELASFTPGEEQKKAYWKTQSDELSRLLDIKKQILQSI